MKQIAIVSADKETIELARELDYKVLGYFDPLIQKEVLGVQALGKDEDWSKVVKEHSDLKVALAIDPTSLREKLARHYGEDRIQTLISRFAFISPSAKIGEGSLITGGVKILADAQIGRGCKLNVEAQVHHDCRVGDYSTLAPRALLLGNVHLGSKVYVGAGAIILPRVKIGDGVVIGAGAVVTKDIRSGVTVIGVPAKEMEK